MNIWVLNSRLINGKKGLINVPFISPVSQSFSLKIIKDVFIKKNDILITFMPVFNQVLNQNHKE